MARMGSRSSLRAFHRRAPHRRGDSWSSCFPRGFWPDHLRGCLGTLVIPFAVLVSGSPVWGHDVVQQARPAANSVIPGGDVPVELRFSGRIDRTRSQLVLTPARSEGAPASGAGDRTIALDETAPPNVLLAAYEIVALRATTPITLEPGAYLLRWLVLSSDGHITRGDIPFCVRLER